MAAFLTRIGTKINDVVARSPVGYFFYLEGSGHPLSRPGSKLTTELRAGITTFFALAYIISVNAIITSNSGGTCDCPHTEADPFCRADADYQACKLETQRDLITATAASSAIGSFMMGLFANLPVAVAPSMALNSYFTFNIVGEAGTGPISYRLAVTAVFIEGFIFVGLSILGLRQWFVKLIPASIKVAIGAGIGLFLTIIGLSSGAGIGAIQGDSATPVSLAGCPDRYKVNGVCYSHKVTDPRMWIGFMIGGILTALLMTYKVRGAMIMGIILVSIMSWPRNSDFTYFPRDAIGNDRFDFFKDVVGFRPIKTTLAVQDWNLSQSNGGQLALAIFTLLYVDIFDCTATLYSMAKFSGVVDSATGDFPRCTLAYCTDALAISIGSLLGVSPVTAYIESGAGIQEGGRTGLTAIITGFCFFISLFFAPIFASIPPWATGGVLVLIGCMMMKGVLFINWKYPGDAIPAFVTLVFMPFSFSIAYGLIVGIMVYFVINVSVAAIKIVSGGRIVPDDYKQKEYWSHRTEGPSPWFVRAVKGQPQFWKTPDAPDTWEMENQSGEDAKEPRVEGNPNR